MPYTQIKEVLCRAVEFHKMLVDFYLRFKDDATRESVKLLTDYMARHEKVIKEQLGQITSEQEKEITEEWIKYEPRFATCKCFERLNVDKHSSVDDIVDAGLTLNQCLIDLYHQVAAVTNSEKIKNLFSNLELMEIAEKKRLSRIRGM